MTRLWHPLIVLLVCASCQPQRTSPLVEMPTPADATTVAPDVAIAEEDQPEFPPQQPISNRISGRVIRVTDGDTLVVLLDGAEQIRIRLEGIDAPESGQPWRAQATRGLSDLVFEQTVDVWIIGEDQYGRKLDRVYVEVGENTVDVNVSLVEQGLVAWHYKRYSDDENLAEAEAAARQERRGLWAAPSPIAPWDWRTQRRETERDGPEFTPAVAGEHWLNTTTGVRHSSRCDNWGKTKRGRPCGPDEGRACGICGGVSGEPSRQAPPPDTCCFASAAGQRRPDATCSWPVTWRGTTGPATLSFCGRISDYLVERYEGRRDGVHLVTKAELPTENGIQPAPCLPPQLKLDGLFSIVPVK